MRGPTQVLSDCPHCRVESALVELIDPSERIGVAIEARCRLCGYAAELGDVVQLGQPFLDHDDVVEALARWAAEDGEADVAVFAVANFNGRDPGAIARAVLAGERVDTGFDVIAWLFPALQGGGPRGDDDDRPRLPRVGVGVGPSAEAGGPGGNPLAGRYGAAPRPQRTAPEPPPVVAPPAPDPRDLGRALASVMLADGQIRPAERRFLDQALARAGAAPLADEDLRVWRPTELGPVGDAKGVIAAMRALALCDHEADGSERRVLEEYARAWQVPLPADPLPRPGAMAELGRALRRLLVR